jgi:biopolymer transport protein TolQ
MNNSSHRVIDIIFGGSPLVQAVLLLLLILSIWTWAIAFGKWLYFRKARRDTIEFSRIFSETRDIARVDDLARRLSSSPLSSVFFAGYKEVVRLLHEHREGNRTGEEHALTSLRNALNRAQNEESSKLEKGTVFLATTASSAPFIGLFGTVWGIMNAFMGLSSQKTSTIAAVAPGISEALIATAVGLAAAIPAAIAYNYIVSTVKSYRRSMSMFSVDFENLVRRSITSV